MKKKVFREMYSEVIAEEVKTEKNNIDEFIQNYEKKTRTRKKKEND